MKFVVASANPDKVAEIAAILEPLGVTLTPRPDTVGEVVEDADTLEGNARLKAVAICDATNLPAMADDTGLEVDALGGAPGVYSARYAGKLATYADNVNKLLRALDGVAPHDRSARFVTAALARFPDGHEVVALGWVNGHIAVEARGTNGFGYDPVFVPDEGDGRTFAEMAKSEKHAVSHRGRAFRELRRLLEAHRE